MALSRTRLSQTLEDAMADIAMLMADNMNYQQKLMEVRQRCLEVWGMAELGEEPEFEMEVRPRVFRERAS